MALGIMALGIKPIFRIEGLGMCEHCGTVFSIEGLPSDAMNAEWKCRKCNGVLTMKSLGYDDIGRKKGKRCFVGPDRKWKETKPENDFNLGSWRIAVGPLPIP